MTALSFSRSAGSLARDTDARKEVARAECRRRILAVASEATQMNIIGASASGALDPADQLAFQASVQWIKDMRAAWEPMAVAGDDPADDANWPALPAAVADLAARF